MSLTPIDLEIDQGDDEIIDITLVAPVGGSVDLTNCKLFFYIKTSPMDADTSAILKKTSAATEGITITDVPTGIAIVTVDHIDTSGFTVGQTGRRLPWSLQVLDATNKITTLAKGTILVNRDLIQATA